MTGDATAAQPSDYATGYEPGVQTYLQLHTTERCAKLLTPHLAPGMSLLDAGCGPGTITIGLAAIVAPGAVTAIDISAEEIVKTEAALRAGGYDNVHVEVASILELPFADDSFDAVHSCAVLDYGPPLGSRCPFDQEPSSRDDPPAGQHERIRGRGSSSATGHSRRP